MLQLAPLALLALAALPCAAPSPALQRQGQRPPPPVATVRCTPTTVAPAGGPERPSDNPLRDALDRAGPGTRITLAPGDYPAVSLGAGRGRANSSCRGGSALMPVEIEGQGRVRLMPGKASETIHVSQRTPVAFVTFRNLEIHCGYRAAVFFSGTGGAAKHEGFHFVDCDIVGDWNHLSGKGVKAKWGVWGSRLADFQFVGQTRRAQVRDICREHGFYLQNLAGDVLIENVDGLRLGRTFLQVTARGKEGPPGTGAVTVRDCTATDVCIAAGDNYKGGSAFTFAGRHRGPVLLERCTVRSGFDERFRGLTREGVPFGTGALVAWDRGVDEPTRSLVLRDCDFQFAPGCGDRPLVALGGVASVRLVGRTRLVAGGDQPALALDPLRDEGDLQSSPLGALTIQPSVTIEGRIERRGQPIERAALAPPAEDDPEAED